MSIYFPKTGDYHVIQYNDIVIEWNENINVVKAIEDAYIRYQYIASLDNEDPLLELYDCPITKERHRISNR